MDLPYLESLKAKEEAKARKKKRIITLVLLILVAGIFGGLFYVYKKENLAVNPAAQTSKSASTQQTSFSPAPLGPSFLCINYLDWNPCIYKEKLVYCDKNFTVKVKTDIDAAQIVAADRFSDDRARILLKQNEAENAYIYIDKSGKIVIPKNQDQEYRGPFSEGLACVEEKSSGRIGFIDKQGKFAIKPNFHISVFATGDIVHKQDQLDNTIFSDGLAPVYTENVNSPSMKASCGYINHSGKYVIPVGYLRGSPFVDSRARVLVKDSSKWKHRWGYIDNKGKFVLKPIYMEGQDFSEGLAAVLDYRGQWGYIDKEGNYSIPAKFSGAAPFHEGFAAAALAKSQEIPDWGYLKKDGSWLVEPQFDRADPFYEGLAFACNGCEDKSKRAKEEYSVSAQGKVEKLRSNSQMEFKFPGITLPGKQKK